ncbi:hypothetical protein AHMF7605_16035 [Adhaeribacter arboris]|uniref:DUF1440 domain-containing protein n=1 Tax=Adhaeribacter arboris TaxID=2072846 RepID=A0A2T2YHC0_9BACT|nr:hypothetical protein [Adhaeribacter arboris]PSR54901.1 hypothetical protein AHMF7605_16035 [Adhaeribacter arboris]
MKTRLKKQKHKNRSQNSIWQALGSGLAGAVAVTLIHETARRFIPNAPRMDVLGMRAIAKGMYKMDEQPPEANQLFNLSIVGDLVSNTLYYALGANGQQPWVKGVLLGSLAGIGGVVLPGPMGLGEEPSGRTPQTKAMTVAWYLLGGLVTAATAQAISSVNRKHRLPDDWAM